VVAITRDTELALLPLDRLPVLPTPCIRAAGPDGLLLDRRNLHADLPGLVPVATVAVVGARVGADPTLLRRVLAAAGADGLRWHAAPDAVVFRIDPAASAGLERTLHAVLLESPR
jgi:hypothetical protein